MLQMFKYLLTLVLVVGGSNLAKAYNESPAKDGELKQEVQLDNIFETNQNAQLQIDQEYAANDIKQSETEFNAEKSRVTDLKAQNQQLTKEIKANLKISKANRKKARIEASKANRLEVAVKKNTKKLEKLKIANINLKKSIEMAAKKQLIAEAKLKRIQSSVKAHAELNKSLKLKKKALAKGKKFRVNKIRTASR